MAQLAERSLLTPEVQSQAKTFYWTITVNSIEKTKIKKLEAGIGLKFFLKIHKASKLENGVSLIWVLPTSLKMYQFL